MLLVSAGDIVMADAELKRQFWRYFRRSCLCRKFEERPPFTRFSEKSLLVRLEVFPQRTCQDGWCCLFGISRGRGREREGEGGREREREGEGGRGREREREREREGGREGEREREREREGKQS